MRFMNKHWSNDEIEYLIENWGTVSVPVIAKKLNRSITGVRRKATKLKLGSFAQQGDYITFSQLINALGYKGCYTYINKKFINEGLPVKDKMMISKQVKIVFINDFWKWAKVNQNKLDFSKFEENILGLEEEWVKEKRKQDTYQRKRYKKTNWSKEEDELLIREVKKYKYTYSELSQMFNRTEGGIERRLSDLGIMHRPLNENAYEKWSEEVFSSMCKMIKEGYSYEKMSENLNKSVKAIRSRVRLMYLTENLEKISGMIGNGKWGDGRPDLIITHKYLNRKEKNQVRTDINKFLSILNRRIKDIS